MSIQPEPWIDHDGSLRIVSVYGLRVRCRGPKKTDQERDYRWVWKDLPPSDDDVIAYQEQML